MHFGGPRGLQVAKDASPLGNQGLATFATCNHKSQKSQALWGTKGLTSSTPKALAQVVSPLWDKSVYKSQKSQAFWGTKGLTSRKSRKLFGGPRGLQVVKVASPLGDQGANMSQMSQALWGTTGLTSRKSRKPFGGPRGLQVAHPNRCTSRKSFGGPRGLHVAKVASHLGDQGA